MAVCCFEISGINKPATLCNDTECLNPHINLLKKSDIHMSVHRNIIANYSQQDATFLEFIYFYIFIFLHF
jgi:hypothetical protein